MKLRIPRKLKKKLKKSSPYERATRKIVWSTGEDIDNDFAYKCFTSTNLRYVNPINVEWLSINEAKKKYGHYLTEDQVKRLNEINHDHNR